MLLGALSRLGFEPGVQLFGTPPAPPGRRTRLHLDTTKCLTGDLLVTLHRPAPLAWRGSGPLGEPRVSTDLEEAILEAWRPFLQVATRDWIVLDESLAPTLPSDHQDRFHLELSGRPGAPYRRLRALGARSFRRVPRGETRTAAFLLRLPSLPGVASGYLGVWAPDDVSTIAWTCLLRERHPELLAAPRFAFAELSSRGVPARPSDLRWALGWESKLLLDLPLEGAHPARRRRAARASRAE